MMILPTSVDPVKATLSTPGCLTRASPAVSPKPGTMLMTPAGNPASMASSPIRRAESGVCSAGLSTTVQPAASAGPHFQADHEHREVPGDDLPGDAHRLASGVAEVPAADRDRLAVDLVGPAGVVAAGSRSTSGRSPCRLSRIGLPLSRVSSWASSSMFASIRSASLFSSRPRSRASILRQGPESNALRAALTARSMSAASPSATWAMTSSVAGLMVANVLPPWPSTHLPSISILVWSLWAAPSPASAFLRGCVAVAMTGQSSLANEPGRASWPPDPCVVESCADLMTEPGATQATGRAFQVPAAMIASCRRLRFRYDPACSPRRPRMRLWQICWTGAGICSGRRLAVERGRR